MESLKRSSGALASICYLCRRPVTTGNARPIERRLIEPFAHDAARSAWNNKFHGLFNYASHSHSLLPACPCLLCAGPCETRLAGHQVSGNLNPAN